MYTSIELNLVAAKHDSLIGVQMELEDLAHESLSKVTINSQRPSNVVIVCQEAKGT